MKRISNMNQNNLIQLLQLKLVAKEAELEAAKWIIEWMKNQYNPCGPHYLKNWPEDQQAQFIRNGFNTVGYYLDEKNYQVVSDMINRRR